MQKNAIVEKQPLKFFLYVFVLSIPFWLAGYLAENAVPEGVAINLPISALMAFNPMIAAIFLSYQRHGLQGARQLFQRAFDFRNVKSPAWFLPSLLLLPLLYVLAYAFMRFARLPLPAPEIPWLLAPVYFFVFFLSGVGEELGWTAYATDPLQSRWGAFGASLILGLVGAIWHIIPYIQAQNPAGWILGQSLYTISTRVLIVWIYNNSGKSVFTTVLFHATSNVCWVLFPNNGSHYDPLVTSALTSLAAVLVIFVWGAKTLAKNRFARVSG